MRNSSIRAATQHDRLIGQIEAGERRRSISITLPEADLRRAVRSLSSRAEQITARRDKDPVLRAAADLEARHCRRISEALAALIREGR